MATKAALWKTLRLIVPAGAAKPSPQIGQALGGAGINMMGFCKDFNAKTGNYAPEIPLRCELKVLEDSSFTYTIKLPRTSYFLLKAANVEKGADSPGWDTVGSVHVKEIYEIAKLKQQESEVMGEYSLEAVCKSIAGQCVSMGLRVRYE